jgi:hypothetical protein
MDGLYAVFDHAAKKVRLCSFPYGRTAGRKEARRLQRLDPPQDVIVPTNPLASIAPADRIAAYHFLMRATVAILAEQNHKAVRYLMAFSALARVRFAHFDVVEGTAGVVLKDFAIITATDYTSVHALFSDPLGDQ